MMPKKNEETLVDVLDVLLRDGAVLRADVVVSVAGIPLVGIKLTAAIAGMETMNEYGLFEEWDIERRQTSITRRQHKDVRHREPAPSDELTVGSQHDGATDEYPAVETDENENGSGNGTENGSGT